MTTYSIIGAGSSSGNPVTVFVGCESSTNICWIGRETVDGYCAECTYHDDQYCSGVTVSNADVTTGTVTWSGASVYYKIVKDCEEKPLPQSCSTYTYSDFSFYTVPTYVEADYNGYISIYYNYTVICNHADGSIGGIDELSDMESIPFSAFSATSSANTEYIYDFVPSKISGECSSCSGVASVYITSDEDTCDSGVTVDVTTSFNPSVVPALPSSGTDVTINVMCRKVEVNNDCTKKVSNSGATLVWHVKCCSACTENSGCCTDHTVSSAFTMDYIRGLAGVDGNAIIRYNGVKATTGIPFSIVQKGKDTEECSGSSADKVTKYCVDSGSVLVEYETSYMSNEWSSGGTVPFEGGRIKVSWKYSACTYSCVDSACTAISCSDSAMTWEEIIDISSCDERVYCLPESEYDPIRDKDKCKCTGSCSHACPDGECSYTCPNNDGEISGNCIIYFKEYDSNCSSCGSGKPENNSDVIYNKIPYTFRQNCKGDCKSYSSITYDKQTISGIDKCFSATSSFTVSGTVTVGYIGFQCSPTTSYTTSATVEVNITPNNSNSARTVFEDDRITLIQDPGPCDDDTLCGAEVTLVSGLARGDYALVEFYTVEPESLQATYSIKSGETAGYYSEDDSVIVAMDSDQDNSTDYIYKYYGSTEEIPSRVTLGCGEGLSSSISAVAESYCACKSLKKISGETAITADGGDSITVAIYSATCDSLNLEVKHVSGDEVLDLSVAPVFNSDSTLTAKVSENTSSTSERTGNYVVRNSRTHINCLKGLFTVKQEKKFACDCTSMSLVVGTDSITLAKEADSTGETTISFDSRCEPSFAYEPTESWLTVNTETEGKLQFTANTENDTGEERVGHLYIKNGDDICKDITITQLCTVCNCSCVSYAPSEECVTCDCYESDFNLLVDSINVPAEGLIEEPIAVVNKCIDNPTHDDEWNITFRFNSDDQLLMTVPANDTGEERTETITFSYSAKCGTDVWYKTLTLTQEAGEAGCTCNSFVFQGEDEGNDTYKYEISAGGTTGTLLAKVNEGCKVIAYAPGTPTGDFNDIASAGCGGGLIFDGSTTLKINAVMNTTSSAREGTMPVTYKISGETGVTDFCTKTIHLVQAAGGPSQSLTVYLKVTGNMYNTRKSNMATIKVNGISVDLRYTPQQGTFENVYAAVAGDAATRINEILCGTISNADGEAILTDESSSTTYRGKVTSTANLYSMANIVINITQS